MRSTVPKVASNLAVKTSSETVPKTVCHPLSGQVGMVRPAVCHPLSGQVDTVGENGLTWAMVGLEGIRSAEVKSLVREVVSSVVDRAERQRRLANVNKKQEMHLLKWMKEVTWDMVGPGVINTVEVKSLVVEVVSSAVDRAEKQRRLVSVNMKQ